MQLSRSTISAPPSLSRSGNGAKAKARRRVEPPPSLPEHVCRVVREEILSGTLAPGERLTEAAVMELTGVGRTPVREGLQRLEGEGLVINHRGRGAFVTYRLSAEEAGLIYDCRVVLEPHLTAMAAVRMTPDGLEGIRSVLEEFAAATETGPRQAGWLDADFHLAIYELSGSELMSVLRGYWSRLQLELSERVYATEVPRSFLVEHRGILEALEARDGDLAAARMRQHILHGRQTMERAFAEDAGS